MQDVTAEKYNRNEVHNISFNTMCYMLGAINYVNKHASTEDLSTQVDNAKNTEL